MLRNITPCKWIVGKPGLIDDGVSEVELSNRLKIGLETKIDMSVDKFGVLKIE